MAEICASIGEGKLSFEAEGVINSLKEGKRHIYYKYVIPEFFKDTCSRVLGYAIDITGRVQAEQALKKAYEEIKEAHERLEEKVIERTSELSQANALLKEENWEREKLKHLLLHKNRELEDFSLKVSHELKNNLLVIHRLAECVHLKH